MTAFQFELGSLVIATVVVLLFFFVGIRQVNEFLSRLIRMSHNPLVMKRIVKVIGLLSFGALFLLFIIVPVSHWLFFLSSHHDGSLGKYPLGHWRKNICVVLDYYIPCTRYDVWDLGILYVMRNGIYIDRLIFGDEFIPFNKIASIGEGSSNKAGMFVNHPSLGIRSLDGDITNSFYFEFEYMYGDFYSNLQKVGAPIDTHYFDKYILNIERGRVIKTLFIK